MTIQQALRTPGDEAMAVVSAALASGECWVVNAHTVSCSDPHALVFATAEDLEWLREDDNDPDPLPAWCMNGGFVALREAHS